MMKTILILSLLILTACGGGKGEESPANSNGGGKDGGSTPTTPTVPTIPVVPGEPSAMALELLGSQGTNVKDPVISIKASATDADEVSFNYGASCNSTGVGSWESLIAGELTKNNFAVGTLNSANKLWAKFRNQGGAESACVSVDFLHDNVVPNAVSNIVVAKDALNSLTTSPDITITTASDNSGGSGIQSVEARVVTADGLTEIRAWGAYTSGAIGGLTLSDNTKYKVEFRAIDVAGNVALSTSAEWMADTVAPVLTKGDVAGDSLSLYKTGVVDYESVETSVGSGIEKIQAEVRLASDNSVVKSYADLSSDDKIEGLFLLTLTAYYANFRAIDKAGNTGAVFKSANFSTAYNPCAGATLARAANYIGAEDTFEVPANIHHVCVKAWGAGAGGPARFLEAIVPVVPQESLHYAVGGAPSGVTGGFPGGGNGGLGLMGQANGVGGAGYTGLFRGTRTQANALVVAGGGANSEGCGSQYGACGVQSPAGAGLLTLASAPIASMAPANTTSSAGGSIVITQAQSSSGLNGGNGAYATNSTERHMGGNGGSGGYNGAPGGSMFQSPGQYSKQFTQIGASFIRSTSRMMRNCHADLDGNSQGTLCVGADTDTLSPAPGRIMGNGRLVIRY